MEKGYLNATNYTVTATSPETWAKTVMRVDGDPGYLRTAGTSPISSFSLSLARVRIMLTVCSLGP